MKRRTTNGTLSCFVWAICLLLLSSCKKSGTVAEVNVYVCGWDWNSTATTKYWKNGSPVELVDGTKISDAVSIFVSGSDVYVAGYVDTTGDPLATYWKNGKPVILAKDANASSIVVEGSDVYVAGVESYGTSETAVYWKNGMPVLLDGTKAFSIFLAK